MEPELPSELPQAETSDNPIASLAQGEGGYWRVYWRLPGQASCQEWRISGKQTGALTRVDAQPAFGLRYALAANKRIIIRGDTPMKAAVGESSLGFLCDDEFEVGPLKGDHLAIGDGVWHLSRESCEAQGAAEAPASCATTLSSELIHKPGEPDLLAYVFAKNGPLTTLAFVEGKLDCQHWRFRDSRLVRRLEHGDGSHTEVSYQVKLTKDQVEVSGPNYQDTGGVARAMESRTFPLERVTRDLVLVGGNPWFINAPVCKRFLAASTRKQGE